MLKMEDTIDMNYLRHCADYMPVPLPRPRRRRQRLLSGYPIIHVATGEDKWSTRSWIIANVVTPGSSTSLIYCWCSWESGTQKPVQDVKP